MLWRHMLHLASRIKKALILLTATALTTGCATMNGARPSEVEGRGPCFSQNASSNSNADAVLSVLSALAGNSDRVKRKCHGGVCVVAEKIDDGNSVRFYFENEQFSSVTASFEVEAKNMVPYKEGTFPEPSYVLAPCQRLYISTYSQLIGWFDWEYNYSFSWDWGKQNAEPTGRFLLPLQLLGATKLLYKPSGGSDASFRFQAPVGTTVLAARSGTIVDFTAGTMGSDVQLDDPGDDIAHLYIENADGTIDRYYYITTGANRVSLGQKVEAGTPIGAVAPSQGPLASYLHFEVTSPSVNDHSVSSTITDVDFLVAKKGEVSLTEGQSYKRAIR